MKCKIPKFELYKVKTDDFANAESWTIVTRKMVGRLNQVYCKIPSCDVMLGPIVLFTLIDFLLRGKLVHSNSLHFPTVFTTVIGKSNVIFPPSSLLFYTICHIVPNIMSAEVVTWYFDRTI